MQIISLDRIQISSVLVEVHVEGDTGQIEDSIGFLARDWNDDSNGSLFVAVNVVISG